MRPVDEEMWDDVPPERASEERFQVPALDEVTRQRAVAEVEAAMAAWRMQTPLQTFMARARASLFWAGYKPRLVLGTLLVRVWCYLTKADSRLVSQKVWRLLKI